MGSRGVLWIMSDHPAILNRAGRKRIFYVASLRSLTGHRAQGTGHRAQGTGHRAQGTEHRAQGTGHRAQGTGRRAQGAGRRAQGTGRRAQGSGHRAQGEETARPQDRMTARLVRPPCAYSCSVSAFLVVSGVVSPLSPSSSHFLSSNLETILSIVSALTL